MVKNLFYAIFFSSILTLSTGTCFANFNYQETVWISLDLPQEQRNQIDDIISSEYQKVKLLQQKQLVWTLSKNSDMLSLLNYMNQIEDIRTGITERMMQVLNPEQQNLFSRQLDNLRTDSAKSFSVILALNLSDSQQLLLAKSLLLAQKRVWGIVSDRSISWEKRRKKLVQFTTLGQISKLILATKLTTEQRTILKQWTNIGIMQN